MPIQTEEIDIVLVFHSWSAGDIYSSMIDITSDSRIAYLSDIQVSRGVILAI